VYDPPYHSKYNPIERCWSALEKKWNGVILNCLKVVLQCALRMACRGQHPIAKRLHGEYPDGVQVPAKEMKQVEARLERSVAIPHFDIKIKPRLTQRQVNEFLPLALMPPVFTFRVNRLRSANDFDRRSNGCDSPAVR
jgi:hypothetical protein